MTNPCTFLALKVFFISLLFQSIALAFPVNIEPGTYTGTYKPSGQSTTSGPTTIDLAEGSYSIFLATGTEFPFNIDASGNIDSPSPAAIGSGSTLFFNNTTFTVDPGGYTGTYSIKNVAGTGSGVRSFVAPIGLNNYTLFIATGTDFLFNIDASGNIDSPSPAATGSNSTLFFNNTTFTVDPGGYTGTYSIKNVAGTGSGVRSFVAPISVNNYLLFISTGVDFLFNIDSSGNVNSSSPAATGSNSTLFFNNTTFTVDPGGYTGTYSIKGVNTTSDTGRRVFIAPIGINNYTLFIATGTEFHFNVDDSGNVNSSSSAATGSGSTLFFNNVVITIDPGSYTGTYNIAGVHNISVSGIQSFLLPESVSNYNLRIPGANERFSVDSPCSLSPEILNISGNDFTLSCFIAPSTYTVGGTLNGLNGVVTLQNNNGDDLVLDANGPFTFATFQEDGISYSITVLQQPENQDCALTNGSGVVSGKNVTDVNIFCTDLPPPPPEEVILSKTSELTNEITVLKDSGFIPSTVANEIIAEITQVNTAFQEGSRRSLFLGFSNSSGGGKNCGFMGLKCKLKGINLSGPQLIRIIQVSTEIGFAINGSLTFDVSVDILLELVSLLEELEVIDSDTADRMKNVLKVVDMFNPENLKEALTNFENFKDVMDDLVGTGILPPDFGEFINLEVDKMIAEVTEQSFRLVSPELANNIEQLEENFGLKLEDLVTIGSLDLEEAQKSLNSFESALENFTDFEFKEAFKDISKLNKTWNQTFRTGKVNIGFEEYLEISALVIDSGFNLADEVSFTRSTRILKKSIKVAAQSSLIPRELTNGLLDKIRFVESSLKAGDNINSAQGLSDVQSALEELVAEGIIPEGYNLITKRGINNLTSNIEKNYSKIVEIELLKENLQHLAALGQIKSKDINKISQKLDKANKNLRLGKELRAMELLGEVTVIIELETVTEELQIQLQLIFNLVDSMK